MRIYLIPAIAYQAKNFGHTVNIFASLVLASNEKEALGEVLLDLKSRYPSKNGWEYKIGDAGDDTDKVKEIVEGL